ncbi:MAG TPA: prolyl oligopeptidase family serine peptidase [Polyangiaceae bacterium]
MKLRIFPAFLLAAACGATPQPPPAPATSTPPPAPATTAPPPPAPSVALPSWAKEYPATHTDDAKDVLFGTEVRDPYRWLESGKSAEVQAWMKAQDDVTRKHLASLPERDALLARLKELYYVDTQSLPRTRGGRVFYERRSGTQEKSVVYWRQGKKGAEKLLLDPNAWSKDGSSSLHSWSVSWDGKKVAYTVAENNSDESTMRLIDVDTGKVSPVDAIAGVKYAYASWTPKGDGFYYVRLPIDPSIPTDKRPGYAELRFHRLGEEPAKDELIHEKTGDPTTFLGGGISEDGRWLFSTIVHGTRSNEVYFRDLSKPGKAWTLLAEGDHSKFNAVPYKGKFYVTTDDGAPKWRVFEVSPAHLERSAWKEIVPERKDATLEGSAIVGGKLALRYLKDVTTRLEIRNLDGTLVREVALPALGTAYLAGDPLQDDAYFSFDTFNHPPEIHETSIAKGGDSVWFKQTVPVDPSAFAVEQVFFPSKDGTRIPMFLVRGKSTPRDGTAPALLTGYGGFSVSSSPGFFKAIIPWLERGGVYALVNLRGGGEYGEEWHRAGMKHDKQHVFDDFEAAAEYLVKEKVTAGDRLAIQGASNGGLLVGAAITQRPDLFRVAVCGVPLLDMVRYHRFGSGRTWIEEYGTAEKEDDFRAILAYSPYQHVTPGTAYPSVLFESADSDDRVDPMHARKMAAELQADSSGGPVLLRIERNAGHSGADLMRAWVEQAADRYAFILAEIKKPGSVMAK